METPLEGTTTADVLDEFRAFESGALDSNFLTAEKVELDRSSTYGF